MSNILRKIFVDLKKNSIIFFSILFLYGCGGEGSVNYVDAPKPGDADGPAVFDFWAKDRRANLTDNIDTYRSLFQVVDADLIAETDHFVLYREQNNEDLMTASEAQSVLDAIEPAFNKLKTIYGNGYVPYEDKKIVILACDIVDDYESTNAYIGGFFAPRDLFSDDLVVSLYNNETALKDINGINYSDIESVDGLKGHSNELQIVYMDLKPFFNGEAYENDKVKAKNAFTETLLHELSHLFTYNYRVKVENIKNHERWIAEGIAEQAPNLLLGLTATQTERMNQYKNANIFNVFATTPPSLLDMGVSVKNVMAGYLRSNLFFNYLRSRVGSDSDEILINNIIKESNSTVIGVRNVIQTSLTTNYESIFEDWVLTNWLKGKNIELNSYIKDGITYSSSSTPTLSELKTRFNYLDNLGVDFVGVEIPINRYSKEMTFDKSTYAYFEYTVPSDAQSFTLPDNNLKIALISLQDQKANVEYFKKEESILFNTLVGNTYSVIIYNDSRVDDSLEISLPWTMNNRVKWIGGNKDGWQTGVGAKYGSGKKEFTDPEGIAVTSEYVYVTDQNRGRVSRWTRDGSFAGWIGGGFDGWQTDNNYNYNYNEVSEFTGYHKNQFKSPQGIAVDSNGNLYIADRLNNRIVKWNSEGQFVGWIGWNGDDVDNKDGWKNGESGELVVSGNMLITSGNNPMSKQYLNSPWSIAIDESDSNNKYIYVSCYGSHRIVRRKLDDGTFAGFVGNDLTNGWNENELNEKATFGNDKDMFYQPKGISLDENYIYVSDSMNHRIVRIDKNSPDSVTSKKWIGGGKINWTEETILKRENQERDGFNQPTDVKVADGFLYIADSINQRIVKWKADGTSTSRGWLGGGEIKWVTDRDGPTLQYTDQSVYPSTYILEPLVLAITPKTVFGSHSYLFTAARYNARVSKWNLDCINDDATIENCTDE